MLLRTFRAFDVRKYISCNLLVKLYCRYSRVLNTILLNTNNLFHSLNPHQLEKIEKGFGKVKKRCIEKHKKKGVERNH